MAGSAEAMPTGSSQVYLVTDASEMVPIDQCEVERDLHLVKYRIPHRDGHAKFFYCSRDWAAKRYATLPSSSPRITTPSHQSQTTYFLPKTAKRRRKALEPLTRGSESELGPGAFNPAHALNLLDRLEASYIPVKTPREIDPTLSPSVKRWRAAAQELAWEGTQPFVDYNYDSVTQL